MGFFHSKRSWDGRTFFLGCSIWCWRWGSKLMYESTMTLVQNRNQWWYGPRPTHLVAFFQPYLFFRRQLLLTAASPSVCCPFISINFSFKVSRRDKCWQDEQGSGGMKISSTNPSNQLQPFLGFWVPQAPSLINPQLFILPTRATHICCGIILCSEECLTSNGKRLGIFRILVGSWFS